MSAAIAKQLITASRYRARHRCARLQHYRYELRIVSRKTPPALVFGTLFHLALEAWWRSWQHGRGETALNAALAALQRNRPESLNPMVYVQLVALMVGYDARWASEMAHIEVLGVECQFEGPLTHADTGIVAIGWRVAGKIDVIVRINGRVYVVEHKTSSADLSPGATYWTRLRMDPQLSIYIDGARLLGHDNVAGCIYDVISKPAIRPLKAAEQIKYTKGKPCKGCKNDDELRPSCEECDRSGWKEAPRPYANQRLVDETLDEYRERLIESVCADPTRTYQRAQVVRLEHELQEARRDLWYTAMQIGAFDGVHPPRNPDACFRYGSVCDYFDVCSGAASLSDSTRFVQRTTAHSELNHDQNTETL